MEQSKGNIYILNITALTKQEVTLLTFLSRRYIQDISEFLCFEVNDSKSEESALELLEQKKTNPNVKEEKV